MENNKLENWLPYKLIKTGEQLQCHWLNMYGKPFTDPFFEETILNCKSVTPRRFVFSSVSDLAMMKEWAQGLSEVEPAALIFHISRCGSTLVSQMLAASEEHIVLSEVPFFDALLRLPYKDVHFNEAATSELLASAINLYGQKKTGQEKRLFIKTDSWHLFFYKQLRHLYPSVPFIFIYRRPDEVFRSHRKKPGMQAVPGLIEPQVFGFKTERKDYRGLDIYLSRVLESYFSQCLDIVATDDQFLLLNYNEGPMPMIEKIAAFTDTQLTRQDLLKMSDRSLYHSKNPEERFIEDMVTGIPTCLDKAMELYHKLEEKRMAIYLAEG